MNNQLPTASAFADFVFSKTAGSSQHPDELNEKVRQMMIGIESEEFHSHYLAVACQCLEWGELPVKKWKVIYKGRSDDHSKMVLESRFLTVAGEPLRCCPDIVLESDDDRKHKIVLIVERKVRTGIYNYPSVPDGAWPNVRAQLWCYAWTDIGSSCRWDSYRNENVIMMTEYYWHPYPERGSPVYMGCRGIWRRDDEKFNQDAIRYFHQFGGEIDPRSNMPGLDA